jgi:two-component system, NtrC family, sensor kinase
VIKTGQPYVVVRYDEKGQGAPGYYEITASPIFDEDGEIVQVVETSRPVTEQIILKRATEESEQRFRQFVDAAHDLITMKNAEGRYLVINPRAAALFGREPGEFIGRTDREVLGAKVARLMAKKERQVIQGGAYQTCQESLLIDGNEHYLDTVRFPLFDYEGKLSGVASISRDVTDHRRLERELIQSEKLAAVGKLAAGVAHELNNPLTGVLTFAEDLLIDAPEDDPRREDYETILREAMRCRQIVRDLLDYSRMEKPHRQDTNLNRVVERAIALAAKQAVFRDVQLDLDLQDDLPAVLADPNQMQQVIVNLVTNAADAMDHRGPLRIVTRCCNAVRSVNLCVSDKGCGIPADDVAQIFEPFYSTKGAQGNGLGLPVVASIIEQHNGRIDVDSQVGVGTTFTVTLPCADESPSAGQAPAAGKERDHAGTGTHSGR